MLYCFMVLTIFLFRITSFEEGAILCNFLPLIREHLPSAAEEIESDIISLAQSEGLQLFFLQMFKKKLEISIELILEIVDFGCLSIY